MTATTLAGFIMFSWPFFTNPTSGRVDAPFVVIGLLPILVLLAIVEISESGMDSKVLAILGVLTAINSLLRALSAGTAGVELIFFLIILAGRVYGPAFGFLLGSTTIFTSAILTSGVGPWMPFQMLAASWVGLGAGLLPKRFTGRGEIILLAAYGVVSAYLFGILMNLAGWPFFLGVESAGSQGSLAFVAGDPISENLQRFVIYTLLTSTGGWDTVRAITTATAISLLGQPVLKTLRRTALRIQPTMAVR